MVFKRDAAGRLNLVPIERSCRDPEFEATVQRTQKKWAKALEKLSGHENCEFCCVEEGKTCPH